MAARLVPNSKEVNEILLLKGDQHRRRPRHCKSIIVYKSLSIINLLTIILANLMITIYRASPGPDSL